MFYKQEYMAIGGRERSSLTTLMAALGRHREKIDSGDATLEPALGVGHFDAFTRLGIKNGFSYSGKNMAFGGAANEEGRRRVAADSAELRKSLGIPESAPQIRIDAQIDRKVGNIVFVGDAPPPHVSGVAAASANALPSLGGAYPDDRSINYPKLVNNDVDIVLTSTPGLTLEMITRDCMAAMIAVKKPGVYVAGLLHAGWRQVDGGIGTRIVHALTASGGIEPKDIQIAIGPALRKGRMVLQHLKGIDDPAAWGNLITKEADGYHVDFVGMFKKQLMDAGVPAGNILDSGIDTYDANARGTGHSARYQEEHGAKHTSMVTVMHT